MVNVNQHLNLFKLQPVIQDTIIGVVLSGGQSSRMGQNKALLSRCTPNLKQVLHHSIDQSMLYFTCQQLVQAGVNKVIISGSSAIYTDEIIADIAFNLAVPVSRVSDEQEAQGPVGGIASVLTAQTLETLNILNRKARYLFVPVDLPLLQAMDLAQLIQAGNVNKRAAHFEKQPLPLFIHDVIQAQKALQQQRAKGDGSVWYLASLLRSLTLLPPEPNHWLNANTPQEWAHAQAMINPAD